MRKLVGATAIALFILMPTAARSATPPPGLGGCRQLIGAVDPSLNVSTAASLRTAAFTQLGKVGDKKLNKLLVAASNGPLLDWCGKHYPLSSLLGV